MPALVSYGMRQRTVCPQVSPMSPCHTQAAELIAKLVSDDSGQDLVEYALLTGLIAVGSVLLFSQLAAAMEASYSNSNTATQNAWEPCPPASSGLACK